MDSEGRQVVFKDKLRDLLQGPGVATSRKKLARSIGVSEATISHYVHGRVKPSFDALVGVATFFNVSLDYLIFGERPAPAVDNDPAGLRSYLRRALLEASDSSGRHLDLMARISRRLQMEIASVAKDLANDTGNFGPVGFITDPEAIGLEACAQRVRIMTREFQSDVSGDDEGAFFEVMTTNLNLGVPYEYLLYGSPAYWKDRVEVFRSLVMRSGVVAYEVTREYLRFRYIVDELPASLVILDLDPELTARQEPILWERHRHAASPAHVWAYIGVEREDAQGGIVIEPAYLESSLRQFSRDWSRADAI